MVGILTLITLTIILFFVIAQIINREPLYIDVNDGKNKKSSNYIASECIKGLRAKLTIQPIIDRFPELVSGRLLYVCSNAIMPLVLSGEVSTNQLEPYTHDIACAGKYVIEKAFEDVISDLYYGKSEQRMYELIKIADSLDISLCSPNLLNQMRTSAIANKKYINVILAPLKYYSEPVQQKIKSSFH
jgi:hypothetical protein